MTERRYPIYLASSWRRLLPALLGFALLMSCDSGSTRTEPEPVTPPDQPENPDPAVVSTDTVYLSPSQQANAVFFLPSPPDIDDADFIDDEVQWAWGMSVRNTDRGSVAMLRMGRTPASVQAMIEGSLKLETALSETTTPALWRLMKRAYWTGFQSAAKIKQKYMRQRPFAMMDEEPWYAADRNDATGSYASASTAGGWATALAFAEMWPPLQNAILRVGFLYGEDRVISGSNFQSDVNGGYLCGAVAMALAHNSPLLKADIDAARKEYKRLMGLSDSFDPTSGMEEPAGVYFLNPPVTTGSDRYEADLARYEHAKTLRNGNRGTQAKQDADSHTDYMTKFFGYTLYLYNASEETTPNIYALIDLIREHNLVVANDLKEIYFRLRPFAELGESTPVPDDEYMSASSSYASGHASFAWASALALAEAVPEHSEVILKRAFEYGASRQIIGYHWASDIEAGRLLACALIAYLHNDRQFCELIQKARSDYQKTTR